MSYVNYLFFLHSLVIANLSHFLKKKQPETEITKAILNCNRSFSRIESKLQSKNENEALLRQTQQDLLSQCHNLLKLSNNSTTYSFGAVFVVLPCKAEIICKIYLFPGLNLRAC